MDISETVGEKNSQQSVEFITSLPATATNDTPSSASINSPKNRMFVSELLQNNLLLNTPSCSGRA